MLINYDELKRKFRDDIHDYSDGFREAAKMDLSTQPITVAQIGNPSDTTYPGLRPVYYMFSYKDHCGFSHDIMVYEYNGNRFAALASEKDVCGNAIGYSTLANRI